MPFVTRPALARLLFLAPFTAGFGAAAWAQPPSPPAPVDPSAISRGVLEQQRNLPSPTPTEPNRPAIAADTATNNPDTNAAAGPAFELKRVDFDKSAFLSPEELQAVVAPHIGQKTTMKDLRALLAQINALYAKRGIATARAVLPPQRITEGVVKVSLIEGRLGQLKVQGGRYTRPDYVKSNIRLTQGQVVDLPALRTSIEAFNANNDTHVQAQLLAGSEVGLTDVVLSLNEAPRYGLQVFVDSYGYETTGRAQGSMVLRGNTLFLDGDRTNLFVTGSEGGLTGSLTYSVPVNAHYGRLGAGYSHSRIEVVNGPSSDLNIDGVSDSGSLSYSAPLPSVLGWRLTGALTLTGVRSTNRISGKDVGETEVEKVSAGFSLAREFGRVAIVSDQTLATARADDSLSPARVHFTQYIADAQLSARTGQASYLHVMVAGQLTDIDGVPSNQLFQIGGPATVRGFAPGASSGPSGIYAQTEWHVSPLNHLDVFTFIDAGRTYSNALGDRGLSSAGLGLVISGKHADLTVEYGRTLSALRINESQDRFDARLSYRF